MLRCLHWFLGAYAFRWQVGASWQIYSPLSKMFAGEYQRVGMELQSSGKVEKQPLESPFAR